MLFQAAAAGISPEIQREIDEKIVVLTEKINVLVDQAEKAGCEVNISFSLSFTARLGLLVRISQIHSQKFTFINLSLSFSVAISHYLFLSLPFSPRRLSCSQRSTSW